MNPLFEYLESHQSQFEQDLTDLLRIPSVSTDPQFASQVREAGEWVQTHLQSLGLKTEMLEHPGCHPMVYAETPPVPGKPVVLVYGHYDVQPPDPLDEWITPPFEPQVRDGKLYARGATDDKGQMLTHVKSVQAWLKTAGTLPLQVKFLIEGEEECGSEAIEAFLASEAGREKLACDIVVISDSSQFAPGQPAITYGLKGIAYYTVRLQGPQQDLHSGVFGGAVTNPANVLAKMMAALVDEKGRIQVPQFYDEVVPMSDDERSKFAALPFTDEQFMQQLGVQGLFGEEGYSTLERRWARPTCDINGLTSGYQGEGAKTVLPAWASAKFSFRLVPDQCPEKLSAQLKPFLESMLPPGIEMEFVDFHGAPGLVVPLDSPYIAAAAAAIQQGFGVAPVMIREGGSIPIVLEFRKQLGADSLLLGWGQSDDNPHSPNEKFSLADFHRGIRTSAQLWQEIANLSFDSTT